MELNITPHLRRLVGLLLVGIGAVLLGTQFVGNAAHYIWPFFIIVPGVVLVAAALAAGDTVTRLAIPGTTITGIGLILFFQNLFNYYESWAYVWALIPLFVGVGMSLSTEARQEESSTAARNLMTSSLITFAAFAVIFEWFIFDGGVFAARLAVPLILILVGAAFLLGWIGKKEDTTGETEDVH